MEIKYNKLIIENFKGCLGKREIVFTPRKTIILGANHSGKTTTADAAHWVLFGKNSEGKTDFGISPKDENGNIILHLDNSVTLELTAEEKEYTVQRVRKERWTKPKGQVDEVLTGYTTYFFINGEKYTEKEYKAFIDSLISENVLRAITNPEYFPSLKPDEQRKLLVKMVGEKSNEEIAQLDKDFISILQSIDGQDLKMYRQHLSYKMKEIKKSIEDIPARISERKSEIAAIQVEQLDFKAIEERIKEIDALTKDNQEKLHDCSLILNDDFTEKTRLRKEIASLREEQSNIERRYTDETNAAKKELQSQIYMAQKNVEITYNSMLTEQHSLSELNRSIEDIERRKANFRDEWNRCEALEFVWDTTKETCPTCGQRLPQGDIERMEQEARERFNLTKSEKQDKLDKIAKKLKSEAERIELLKSNSEKKLDNIKSELENAKKELRRLEGTKVVDSKSYHDDIEWQRYGNEITEKETELRLLDNKRDNDVNDTIIQLNEANNALHKERNGLTYSLSKRETVQNAEKRIKELTTQQQTLSQQLADLEKMDYTAERFEYAIIQDLEDRVNGLFTLVKFNMFKQMINGNREPTCTLTMHGTEYRDLSNSEKIIAGLECIEAICNYNHVYAPIWIDNAESINIVPPTISQQILLVVSDDNELVVI